MTASNTTTHPTNNEQRSRLFQEIASNKLDPIDLLPDQVEAYISKISPSNCATVIQQLGYILPLIKFDDARYSALDEITGNRKYPWPALGHLRRVRRISCRDQVDQKNYQKEWNPSSSVSSSSSSSVLPKRKRPKTNPNHPVQLEIVLGATSHVDYIQNATHNDEYNQKQRTQLNDLIASNDLQLEKRFLPGRPAKSQTELEEWGKQNNGNGWWPTVYFEKQSVEHRQKELALNLEDEHGFMRTFLLEAIQDAQDYQKEQHGKKKDWFQGQGVVIVCPVRNRIVSKSYCEWKTVQMQEECSQDNVDHDVGERILGNPLNTPVMFAIQGVSRLERQAALGQGLDSESFRRGQYLCTG
jgi:hypothetical protein